MCFRRLRREGRHSRTDLTWDVYSSYGHTLFNNLQRNDSSKAAFAAILNGTANFTGATGSCVGYAWNRSV